MQYIKENYKVLNECLKNYTESFYNFFVNILNSNADYILILSRRCYVLYLIFRRFIFKNDVCSNAYFITDKATSWLISEIKKDTNKSHNILIVDDVLIHGRTVAKVYLFIRNELSKLFGSEEAKKVLRICVCKQSNERYNFCTDQKKRQELLNNTYADGFVTTIEWKKLAEYLVKLIHKFGMPYLSFLLSMQWDLSIEETKNALFDKISILKTKFSQNQPLEKKQNQGKDPFSYYECAYEKNNQPEDYFAYTAYSKELPNFFKKFCDAACIRIYYVPPIVAGENAILRLIPTVIPKSVEFDAIQEYLENLYHAGLNLTMFSRDKRDYLSQEIEKLKELYSTKQEELYIKQAGFCYRLSQAILSIAYGCYCMTLWNFPKVLYDNVYKDFDALKGSFPQYSLNEQKNKAGITYFANFIFDFSLNNKNWTINEDDKMKDLSAPEVESQKLNKYLNKIFPDSLQNTEEASVKNNVDWIYNKLLDFYFLDGLYDEEKLSDPDRWARDVGVSTQTFLNLSQKLGIDRKAFLTALISVWDTGRASMNGTLSENKKFFATFTNAGERACCKIQDIFPSSLLKQMAQVEEILLYQETEDMQNYSEDHFQNERIKKFKFLIKSENLYKENEDVISTFLEYLKSSKEFISHYRFS